MELRRFAPVWILYTVGMLLYAAAAFSNFNYEPDGPLNAVAYHIREMGLINFAYALVLAQLLFGDLYNTRLCFSLHSLPITRGGWFGTQIILGILGSLIPNLITAGMMLLYVKEFQIVILWWWLAVQMQFLFFFGAAVLCAVCSGNRFGMVILYALLNFAAVCAAWMQLKVYASLIYAMYLPDIKVPLSPIVYIDNIRIFLINVKYRFVEGPSGEPDWQEGYIESVNLNGELWTLLIYAAVGCALIALAMYLYRKRKAECAGDLLAFPKMEPAFLVVFTICAGAAGTVVAYRFAWQMKYLMLALGLVGGYYACLMLLRRQVNVFTKKTFCPIALICGVMLLSLVLTGMNAFGFTYKVPNAEDVASVQLGRPWGGASETIESSDPDVIQKIISIQEEALERHRQIEASRPLMERIFGDEGIEENHLRDNGQQEMTGTLRLVYTLKNGSTLKRCYFFNESCDSIPVLKELFSSPDMIFTDYYANTLIGKDHPIEEFLPNVEMIQIQCNHRGDHEMSFFDNLTRVTEKEQFAELLEAILADCEENNTAQENFLHADCFGTNFDYVTIWYQDPEAEVHNRAFDLVVYSCCTNTQKWMLENGVHTEPIELN